MLLARCVKDQPASRKLRFLEASFNYSLAPLIVRGFLRKQQLCCCWLRSGELCSSLRSSQSSPLLNTSCASSKLLAKRSFAAQTSFALTIVRTAPSELGFLRKQQLISCGKLRFPSEAAAYFLRKAALSFGKKLRSSYLPSEGASFARPIKAASSKHAFGVRVH